MRIYVAGPLTSDLGPVGYIVNVARMCHVAIRLWRLGHLPYVPGLDFLLIFASVSGVSEPLSLGEVRDMNMQWLPQCQGLYLIAHSPGADAEALRARQLGLPVYESIEDIPEAEVGACSPDG